MQRPLLLNGFTATGKSTVGAIAARQAQVPFVDLPEAGRARVRAGGGAASSAESVVAERELLERLLGSGQPQVIALGPDTLLLREARLRALEQAVVVTLQSSASQIGVRAARAGNDSAAPSRGAASLAEVLDLRREAYAEAHARLETGEHSPEQLAAFALQVWRRGGVAVAAGSRSYAVEIGHGLALERIGELLRGASKVVLVTDRNVYELHGARIAREAENAVPSACAVVLDPGEEHKTIASLERIWQSALRAGADRSSVVLAVGGGVVTDVAGFAAACWMRGVRWIALPTTLLAMVDASVGGKTAVDLLTAKNAVGAFWQPSSVLCDVEFLKTEQARGYRSALAEVVKTALIGDPELFELLEQQVAAARQRDPALVAEMVRRSVAVKAGVVSRDEREGGLRACLNLGHTIGHALESHGGYTRLTHGEAVSLGLVVALQVGQRMGVTPATVIERTRALLEALGLPTQAGPSDLIEASALLGHDKKRAGQHLRFVVAREIGRVEPVRLGLDELRGHVECLAR